MRARNEIYVFKELLCPFASVGCAGDFHRHQYVFERREGRHQMKRLKDEPNLCAAELGKRVFTHVIDRLSVDANLSRSRRIESGDQPEKGRLAAARRPNDGDELAVRNCEIERV